LSACKKNTRKSAESGGNAVIGGFNAWGRNLRWPVERRLALCHHGRAMFGILKSGLKLGIGCFVAGILFALAVAGLIFYYCGRGPAPRPRNTNRRAAVRQADGRAAALAVTTTAPRPSARPLVQDGDGFFGGLRKR
jgi:hypothetical protein